MLGYCLLMVGLVGRLAVRRHICSGVVCQVLLLWLWPYISGLLGTVHFDLEGILTSWFKYEAWDTS